MLVVVARTVRQIGSKARHYVNMLALLSPLTQKILTAQTVTICMQWTPTIWLLESDLLLVRSQSTMSSVFWSRSVCPGLISPSVCLVPSIPLFVQSDKHSNASFSPTNPRWSLLLWIWHRAKQNSGKLESGHCDLNALVFYEKNIRLLAILKIQPSLIMQIMLYKATIWIF